MSSERKFDIVLFLICFFLGWLGIDKIYKGDIKFFIFKLIANIFVIGVIWNIYDIVCCIIGKYKINPFA